jgi:hypothetical protein
MTKKEKLFQCLYHCSFICFLLNAAILSIKFKTRTVVLIAVKKIHLFEIFQMLHGCLQTLVLLSVLNALGFTETLVFTSLEYNL